MRRINGILGVAMTLLSVFGFLVPPKPAYAAKTIEWRTLLPQLPPLKDPLTGLTQDQRFDIETISWARGLNEEERKLIQNKQGLEDAAKYERQFEQAGLKVDEILTKYRSWESDVEQRRKLVNTALNGEQIRMPGYLLPLEFSEEGETDFLLVPYVGACIHVPPPPANQIVFVRLTERFKVDDLFTAVWVTGTMKTKQSSKALTLVDGSTDVSVGYHIDDGSVEVYRQE
ncbi:MAG: DUF3299 domain-containing protein [Hyphomicrobiaceae bacterium]